MNEDKKRKLTVIVAGSVAALVVGLLWVRSEANLNGKLEPLLQPAGEPLSMDFGKREEFAAVQRRRVEFEGIWKARHERNVAAEILPFLNDPAGELRFRAVRALGQLESTEAEAPLQALLDKTNKSRDVNSSTLRLALGRIRSRHEKGEPRIAAMSKSVGLAWGELERLSQKVNSRRGHYSAESAGTRIIEEVVDVFYTMTQRGENTSGIIRRLRLNSAQQVKLEAAALPPEQEAERLIDYLAHREVVTGDEMELGRHLSEMAPQAQAEDQVLARLKQMQRKTENIKGRGYSVLFDAVAKIKGPEALTVLKLFEQNSSDRWIPHYAKLARQEIERREAMRRGDSKAFSVPGYIVIPDEVPRPNP